MDSHQIGLHEFRTFYAFHMRLMACAVGVMLLVVIVVLVEQF